MKVSLVIPVKNEEANVPRLMNSISVQTRPPDEVVFVDAGSTDGTVQAIERCKPSAFEVRLISLPDAYPGTARNAGVRASRYDVIAFTDGGIELDNDWLRQLVSTVGDGSSCDGVYGTYAPRADTLFKQCLSLATISPPVLLGEKKTRPPSIASALLKKSVWQKAGPFPDFRAAEDKIFMERVGEMGFAIRYNPEALVTWEIPKSAAGAFNKFYQYSYHDLKAGRAADWHLGVLRMYVVFLAFIFLAVLISPFFALIPLLAFAARAARRVFINRKEKYFRLARLPAYLALTAFILAMADIAMFLGWGRYLAGYKREKRLKANLIS